jgi:hypothetical protein
MFSMLDNTTPFWPDDCDHKPGEYVGTFRTLDWPARDDSPVACPAMTVDVYVYSVFGGPAQGVCLRVGRHGDYHSIRVDDLFSCQIGLTDCRDLWRAARYYLLERGTFRWQPRPADEPVDYSDD